MSIIIKNIEYIKIKELGKGGSGRVHQVLSKLDNKFYAIKEIPIKEETEENIKSFQNEAYVLSKFNCRNIVKYYDSFIDSDNIYILMEFCEGENLRNFIDKNIDNNTLIQENILNNIIKQMCIGIKEIHNKKIVHRDIKPENIFISNNMEIKIGDFGISKQLNLYKTHLTTKNCAGTYYYIAPEILNNGIFNEKSDIWSLGCIIYELFTLNIYFKDLYSKKIRKINSDIYNNKWQILIDSLLQPDYTKRFDIIQISKYLEEELKININNTEIKYTNNNKVANNSLNNNIDNEKMRGTYTNKYNKNSVSEIINSNKIFKSKNQINNFNNIPNNNNFENKDNINKLKNENIFKEKSQKNCCLISKNFSELILQSKKRNIDMNDYTPDENDNINKKINDVLYSDLGKYQIKIGHIDIKKNNKRIFFPINFDLIDKKN